MYFNDVSVPSSTTVPSQSNIVYASHTTKLSTSTMIPVPEPVLRKKEENENSTLAVQGEFTNKVSIGKSFEVIYSNRNISSNVVGWSFVHDWYLS